MDEFKQIAVRLRRLREKDGDTQQDLANILGCSLGAYRHYERATRRISLPDLRNIADHYGVSINYFLGIESDEDRVAAEVRKARQELERARRRLEEVMPYHGEWVWLPLIGTVPAGYPEWQDPQEAEEFYPCSVRQIEKRDGAYALRVKGDSVIERRILDGDVIFIDANGEPQLGDVVVAQKDDEVVLRIYKQDAKGPYLQAGNQGYPILRSKDARILGVVMGLYREKA